MRTKVECASCYKICAGRIPTGGDGSLWLPRRHRNNNNQACPGNVLEAKIVVIKNVVRIDRSPMNELVWCIQLECNHDVFRTAKKKPTVKQLRCEKCEH